VRLSKRPVVIYDLPLPKGTAILQAESAIIRFSNGKSSDFGALCFLRREAPPLHFFESRRQSEGRLVDQDSFVPERAERVLALISHISDDLKYSGRRTETIRDAATRFVAFMFWADTNGHHAVMHSAEAAKQVVHAYVKHLRERVMTDSISINGAVRQQNAVIGLLERFLERDDLIRGVNLLRKNPAAAEATTPPDEDTQARVLGLCESLFDGLASFLLDAKPYPYALALPKYLNFHDNLIWIFPTTSWFMTPQMLTGKKNRWSLGYNFGTGKVSTTLELLALEGFSGKKHAAHNIINRAKRQLHIANTDPNHSQRIHLGMIALNSFVLLFLAQTGMNWAQLVNLTWADEYDISATHQAFRTIKWRAGNVEVAFEIPVSFMPKFNRYLELRRYLLGNKPFGWLFFTMGVNEKGRPSSIRSGGTSNIYQSLQRIDPNLSAVTPRQWRAAKSDWLIRNTDPSTTALVLQNTEKTVLSSYAAGSDSSHLDEITSYFNSVSETIVDKGQVIDGGVSNAIGYCSAYGAPHIAAEKAAIQPNCNEPEGCLFCNKFKIHVDEIDTRKLLSFRYCLRLTAPLISNIRNFHTMQDEIFKRVEEIIVELSHRDKSLVFKVAKEVEEDGELAPYWARKLEMLQEIGLAE
jgi:hypothetical protein